MTMDDRLRSRDHRRKTTSTWPTVDYGPGDYDQLPVTNPCSKVSIVEKRQVIVSQEDNR